MADTRYVVAFITAPGMEEAAKIARALVEERLAACCNLIGPVTSIYRWAGDIAEDPEVLIVAKTRKSYSKKLAARVLELHSYDVPEVIFMTVTDGSPSYMKWLYESTRIPSRNR